MFADRLKEVREGKGWTQQRLAQELQELGDALTQGTIARIETKAIRRISLDDALAIAAALGVSPLHLLAPTDDDSKVAITAKLSVLAPEVRAWVRGQKALRPQDERTYFIQTPDRDLGQIPAGVSAAVRTQSDFDRICWEIQGGTAAALGGGSYRKVPGGSLVELPAGAEVESTKDSAGKKPAKRRN